MTSFVSFRCFKSLEMMIFDDLMENNEIDYEDFDKIISFVKNFADGEIYVQVKESVRGDDVFIIQPVCNPVNENLMELLIMIDAAKRASAGRITAVVPYFGYARQDRKASGREGSF